MASKEKENTNSEPTSTIITNEKLSAQLGEQSE